MIEVEIVAKFQATADATFGRQLHIAVNLAGRPLLSEVDGFAVTLEYPPWIPGQQNAEYRGSMHLAEDESTPIAIAPIAFSARTVAQVPHPSDEQAMQSELKKAWQATLVAATRLSDAGRISQPSAGLVGQHPMVLARTAKILASGELVIIKEPLNPGYPIMLGSYLKVGEVEAALLQGPSITRALLSQATFLIIPNSSPQPGLAVLLAAVACEAEGKKVLLASARGELRGLVDVFLRKPRIFQEPAVELYGEVAKAVIGHSLKEDDRELWKQLVSLFETRNRMAHVADTPSVELARTLVVAANRAVLWLDQTAAVE